MILKHSSSHLLSSSALEFLFCFFKSLVKQREFVPHQHIQSSDYLSTLDKTFLKKLDSKYSVQFSCSVMSDSLWPYESQHTRPPCPSITNSRSSLRLTSIKLVMPSSHLILSSPFPPALNPSQHQSLFQWINSSHEVAKVLEFQL